MRFQELVLGIKRSEMQRLGLKEEVGLGRGMKEERDGIQALDQTLKEERREINLQAPLEMISIFLIIAFQIQDAIKEAEALNRSLEGRYLPYQHEPKGDCH